ncbi:hypothetical protein VOLCADRAFT_72600 [Volvox carteri f. nagariensis]|uniref:Uncharacterized protein n=1 Tax=Volvox carteri f. nagariensis TaxID=3068 RepID=D8TIU5_VOLCA|nr:uncharacterized protein VOLCADRAFT_72600 [Volvox carteri f. nagariensis]EFJ53305.1 hypothetical protein VOLCADRAFT_72600 [Volvox carteri f. nagariensis]|eukprot:XP_002946310.1 hypothetical protein VOLCADRAFT_72600 [Volvox carteri f. nagariensis]
MQETMGWRHFRVIQCRKGASGVVFVQMQASCDPATQLWINASNLKDRDLWAAGWLQMSEVTDPAGALVGGVTCRTCSGTGATPCPVCDATGAVLLPPSGLGGPRATSVTAASAVAAPADVDSSGFLSTSSSSGGSSGVADDGDGTNALGHSLSGRAGIGTGDASGAGAAAVVGGGGGSSREPGES